MRWIKHLTTTKFDEKISSMESKLGMEGYGFWWRTLEIIALTMDAKNNKTSATHPLKNWAKFYGFSVKKFKNFAEIFQNSGLFSLEIKDDFYCVNIPNLLKYRDEWTRRSVKNVVETPEQELDTDLEANTDTKTSTYLKASSDLNPTSTLSLTSEGKPSKEILPPKVKNEEKASSEDFLNLFPDGWKNNVEFRQLLSDFYENRKQMKKRLTPIACKKLKTKLIKFPIDIAILALNRSIENGWIGIFPESVKLKIIKSPDPPPKKVNQELVRKTLADIVARMSPNLDGKLEGDGDGGDEGFS